MNISELSLKLILILIPGAIACILFEILTTQRKRTTFQYVINIILFGGFSYILAQIFLGFFSQDQDLSKFWDNLSAKEIPFNSILKASVASIFVVLIAVIVDYNKIINKIGSWLHITNKYGDENVFSFFLNQKTTNEIYIRDIKNNLTYHGMIRSFSETNEYSEMVLENVNVYSYQDSAFLYKIEKIYLSYPKNNLIIETPYINGEKNG